MTVAELQEILAKFSPTVEVRFVCKQGHYPITLPIYRDEIALQKVGTKEEVQMRVVGKNLQSAI